MNLKKILLRFLIPATSMLVVLPSSTYYKLSAFEFGGGGASMSSSLYTAEGIIGEVAGSQSSSLYSVRSGLVFMQQTNTPPEASLSNEGSYYNKLLMIINTGNNPSDATYAVAITDDNWTTTQYVQNDNTIGGSLGPEDFQTYAQWGGAAGEDIIGLEPDTTYTIRVKARQGYFTEGPFGPQTSEPTLPVSLTFDIDISDVDSETSAPYDLHVGDLSIGAVTTSSNKIWVDLDTNAENGGFVFVSGANTGLRSSILNYTISSSTTDLSGANEGYGIRTDTVSNLSSVAPYNGAGDNVGVVDTTIREIVNSSSNPVVNGRASFAVKVKTSNLTPSSNDYTDVLTLIASGSF